MMTLAKAWRMMTFPLVLGVVLPGCEEVSEPPGPDVVRAVDIREEAVRLHPGDRQQLNVESGGGVEWQSRDPDIVAVDGRGRIAALAPGMSWVLARSDGAVDSVRISVSFSAAPTGAIALGLGAADEPLRVSGVSRIIRPLTGGTGWVYVTAAAGTTPSPDLHLEDFFAGQDTVVILTVTGELGAGFRTITPWTVDDQGQGLFRIAGAEGAMVWIRDPTSEYRSHVYIPVEDVSLEIDRSDVPAEIGPASGALVGRMSFEAAGLVVEFGPGDARIVGQVSTNTTRVFAEFDLTQRIHPIGRIRTSVSGGPLPLELGNAWGPEAGLWQGGLLLNTGLSTSDGRLYFTQIWQGTPAPGDVALDGLALEELMDGSALAAGRTWAWTESGSISALETDGSLSNLGLASGGRLVIERYDPPGDETWGQLEGTLVVDQDLSVGGEAGASQSVTLEILAPVMPTSRTVYPHQPSVVVNHDDIEFGPGILRVGNGPLELPGQIVETTVHPVADVLVTLSWEGGSASVRTNDAGDFLFTGVHPGTYTVDFEVPAGYDLAARQRRPVGPLTLSADHQMWALIHFADAEGNGGLRVFAGSSGINTMVDGVQAVVRPEDESTVVATLVTGSDRPHTGMASTKLPPGRYTVEFIVPAGYRLLDGQSASVTVEIFKGHELPVHVGVVRQD